MAKDGTNRGGKRPRTGPKTQPLSEKIAEGKTAERLSLNVFEPETKFEPPELPAGADLPGSDMPKPDEYLSREQKEGEKLKSTEIYKEIWLWLRDIGCDRFIQTRMIESFSQAFARFISCEEAISKFGYLGQHPTTKAPIASPYIQISQSYLKQSNIIWMQIMDIVKQNCTVKFDANPHDDVMERLLLGKVGVF